MKIMKRGLATFNVESKRQKVEGQSERIERLKANILKAWEKRSEVSIQYGLNQYTMKYINDCYVYVKPTHEQIDPARCSCNPLKN